MDPGLSCRRPVLETTANSLWSVVSHSYDNPSPNQKPALVSTKPRKGKLEFKPASSQASKQQSHMEGSIAETSQVFAAQANKHQSHIWSVNGNHRDR